MRSLIVFVLLTFVYASNARKIGIFMLDLANSQLIFNKRIAETLIKDPENDVTLIKIQVFPKEVPKIDIDPAIKIHTVDAFLPNVSHAELEKSMTESKFVDLPMWHPVNRRMMSTASALFSQSCEQTITNKEFMQWFVEQKFDLVFVHMYNFCPIGIVHHAKVPTWIWLSSGGLVDYISNTLGVPQIPSYTPPILMASGAQLNFFGRLKSLIGHVLLYHLYPRMVPERETEHFRKHISPDFPSLYELSKKAPLAMINTDELYDVARPTLHKVVNIGGLGMKFSDAKPLTKEFQAIVDKAKKGVVLFTFGSMAKMESMPQAWKTAVMQTFAKFPDYQFVLRYTGNDSDSIKPPNVHLSPWIPQADLLKNAKTVGFISHGGYNSVQEALNSGQPIMTIALSGDQPKNSALAEEIGFGINIAKSTMSAETFEEGLRKMLFDEKYRDVAKRISHMIRQKPIKPEELLLRWTKFVAEFKTLDNLVPYGTQLSFFVYHSLDVISFLLVVSSLLCYAVFAAVRWVFVKCRSKLAAKPKTE